MQQRFLQAVLGGLLATHVAAFQSTIHSPLKRAGTRSRLQASVSEAASRPVVAGETETTTDAVVCGGGPAGLLTAIMLAQTFPDKTVKLYDRLAPPPSPTDEAVWSDVAKFYLIGLGSRGQRALSEFGVWKEVEAVSTAVLGRMDWSPESEDGVERIFTDRPVTTQVLPRDKLVGVLHNHILKNYADQVKLNYGYEVTPTDFAAGEGDQVVVRVSKCEDMERINPNALEDGPDVLCDTDETLLVTTGLLVGADGTARTIANQMEEQDEAERKAMNPVKRMLSGRPFRVRRYEDDNQRIYKTIPLQFPEDWRFDLNYSARSKGGRVTFDALPANRKGSYCGALLLKKDDPYAQPDCDPEGFRQLMDEFLPQFSAILDDETIATTAKKPVSFLPGFRFVGPRLNQGKRTVLLGDCAHTVKPYFGLGANSALEDVKFLRDAIESTDNLSDAVKEFSDKRAGEAEALVKISRELDRPGKLGFVTFILPLILDSIFHRLAPKIFEPNTIAMLQRDGYGFRQVARRKRLDRIGQIGVIGGGIAGMVAVSKFSINALARALGKKSSTVVGGIAAAALAARILTKMMEYLVPGMAPADVLNKTKGQVTSTEGSSAS